MTPLQTSLFATSCAGGRTFVTVECRGREDNVQPRAVACPVCGQTWELWRVSGITTGEPDWCGRDSYLLPAHERPAERGA